jgi:hypothetical protein
MAEVKKPLAISALPFVGVGFGAYLAHKNKPIGAKSNSAVAYFAYTAIFLALCSFPLFLWNRNRRMAEQREDLFSKGFERSAPNIDIDSAWSIIQDTSTKTKTGIKYNNEDKAEFSKAFYLLTDDEKIAFIQIAKAINESTKYKKKKEGYEFVVSELKNISEKYGKETLEEIQSKLGKFTRL